MTIKYIVRHPYDGAGAMIDSIAEREYDDPLGVRAPREKYVFLQEVIDDNCDRGYHVGQMVDRVNRRRLGDPLGVHQPRKQMVYMQEVELDDPESFEDDDYEYSDENKDADEGNNRVIIICNKYENGTFS